MIDLHLDEQDEQVPLEAIPQRVGVIGVGQAGVNVLDQLVMHGLEPVVSLAIDTDQGTIEGSVAAEKLLFGSRVARGLGCTGDLVRGTQIWRAESAGLERFLLAHREIIILVGLGGGTGSAFALEAVKMAKLAGVRVLVVCTMPFSFETGQRQEVARRILKEIRALADGVLILTNDGALPWPCSRDNIRQSYHVLNQLLAKGVESLLQIMDSREMVPLEFSDLQALFGSSPSDEAMENCWIGVGEVEAEQGVEELVQMVLESPLLEENASWQQANAGLACLVGGADFSLVHLQQLTKALEKRLGSGITIRVGAKLDPFYQGKMRLSLLLAARNLPTPLAPEKRLAHKTSPLPAPEPIVPVLAPSVVEMAKPVVAEKPLPSVPRVTKAKPKIEPVIEEVLTLSSELIEEPSEAASSASGRKKSNKQEELPFDSNRGRFDKSHETIYRGENLDQPTFRRRKLAIKV